MYLAMLDPKTKKMAWTWAFENTHTRKCKQPCGPCPDKAYCHQHALQMAWEAGYSHAERMMYPARYIVVHLSGKVECTEFPKTAGSDVLAVIDTVKGIYLSEDGQWNEF